ncbi:hypothetical protein BLSTO_06403, partial [Blastocystis sp. subtype 1]
GIKDPEEFCKNLKTPRVVLFLARNGSSIDRNIQKVVPFMEAGDIVVDGSTDSVAEYARRAADMQEKGVQYITMGIAGSDTDARKGSAFLVSGPQEAYAAVEPLLTKVAAAVDDHPCVARVGEGSAASYAKMICDSIEIGECQLLAEAYDVMRHARLNNQEMAGTFAEWNKTEQESYLLDITSTILLKKD